MKLSLLRWLLAVRCFRPRVTSAFTPGGVRGFPSTLTRLTMMPACARSVRWACLQLTGVQGNKQHGSCGYWRALLGFSI